jgi:hypothetical protein
MMPRMWEGARPHPARRALLLGALAAVPALAGCGVRLEDDAPRVPLIPTREPVAGEGLLTALTRDTLRLAGLAAATPGTLAADLAPLHVRQHTVLRDALLARGVPAEALGMPAPSPTTSPSPSPTTSAGADKEAVATLADAEGSAAAGADRFMTVEADLRVPVAALHAQRFAAGWLLGGTAPRVPTDSVAGDVVEELAAHTAGAIYLVEVAAARSSGAQRRRARATRDVLAALLADQVAGGSRPEDSLGVPLPFTVRTAADAARLARTALTTLRDAHGARLEPLLEGSGGAGWSAATRWLGTVEAECHRWGVPLAAFPGLT